MQVRVPAVYMRGGTSKAVFFHENHLMSRRSIFRDPDNTRFAQVRLCPTFGAIAGTMRRDTGHVRERFYTQRSGYSNFSRLSKRRLFQNKWQDAVELNS